MALTRQHFRHIAYLLEVAPIAKAAAAPLTLPRRPHICSPSGPKRRLFEARHFQTTTIRQKARSKASSATNLKNRSSATGTLVSDVETTSSSSSSPSALTQAPPARDISSEDSVPLDRLNVVLTDARKPLQLDRAVAEKDALSSLMLCHDLAKAFKDGRHNNKATESPAINLLFLETDGSSPGANAASQLERANGIKDQALRKIAATARAIVTDPKVFITPKILESYVQLRSFIEHPEDLAEVFGLYANKPIPEPKSSPVKYSDPSSDKASFAIPLDTAKQALDAAIETKNLPLCFDIIRESTAKTAFKRHKLIQKALLPGVAVGLAPVAAYALASQFAVFQENLYTDTARWMGFAGIMSYFVFTGTIGMVAVTTANDQMERVVWQDGTPLRERWLREEERSMFDRVAIAWGFKDPYRKGEEEGPDWEALRELISLRGMILDKVELMEGMQ